MSAEITAGTEEMAASAGEIAHTASELSQQSTTMAQSIQSLSSSADQLVRIAGELRDGAHEGVERNRQLRGLSLESRAKLDESSQALELLEKDVGASASAIEGLAKASLEVRSFVTLVQKLARQSKLLALNAAMEAARHLVTLQPEAVELVDRTMIDLGRGIPIYRPTIDEMLIGEPDSLLIVEFHGQADGPLLAKLGELDAMMGDLGYPGAVVRATDAEFQARIASVRHGHSRSELEHHVGPPFVRPRRSHWRQRRCRRRCERARGLKGGRRRGR